MWLLDHLDALTDLLLKQCPRQCNVLIEAVQSTAVESLLLFTEKLVCGSAFNGQNTKWLLLWFTDSVEKCK